MADYRVYFLDHANHIRGVVEFESDDDLAAVDYAATQADGRRMELWSRARFIRVFEPAEGDPRDKPQGEARETQVV